MGIQKSLLGEYQNKKIYSFILENKCGFNAEVSNFGATVLSIKTFDTNNKLIDVVLGMNKIQDYFEDKNTYMGATIGRCAGRIPNASFTFNNINYPLSTRQDKIHLHGGGNAFNKAVWDFDYEDDKNYITFKLLSPDGENGYPGTLITSVKYSVTDENELVTEYQAQTNKATIFNPTNHIYFNLAGHTCKEANHIVKLHCDSYIQFGQDLLSTGQKVPVKDTPYDFSQNTALLKRIFEPQLRASGGYDNYFLADSKVFDLIAEIYEKNSGVRLHIYTNQPGMVFYATADLGSVMGKAGENYDYLGWFCVEPQGLPITNHKGAKIETILRPKESYYQKTVFKFS